MRKSLLIISAFVILVFVILTLMNPIVQPTTQIREEILEKIPIGTTIDDVVKYFEANVIQCKYEFYDGGYLIYDERGDDYPHIIKKTMEVSLGKYGWIIETYVVAILGFDEDSKLIDVIVRKDVDSL